MTIQDNGKWLLLRVVKWLFVVGGPACIAYFTFLDKDGSTQEALAKKINFPAYCSGGGRFISGELVPIGSKVDSLSEIALRVKSDDIGSKCNYTFTVVPKGWGFSLKTPDCNAHEKINFSLEKPSGSMPIELIDVSSEICRDSIKIRFSKKGGS